MYVYTYVYTHMERDREGTTNPPFVDSANVFCRPAVLGAVEGSGGSAMKKSSQNPPLQTYFPMEGDGK